MHTKRFISFSVCLFILLLTSCYDEATEAIAYGRLSLSINMSTDSPSGGRMFDDVDVSAVLVSIEKADGTLVHDLQELRLLNFGTGLVSEELELPVGNYRITKFIVIDSDDNVVYATPLAGSQLGDIVERPLPMEYTISAGEVNNLLMEVISVAEVDPEGFGYTAFKFVVVDTKDISIDVSIADENFEGIVEYKFELIAKDSVFGNVLWEKSWQLSGSSEIKIPTSYEHFTFTVSGEGYLPHVQHYMSGDIEKLSHFEFELLPGDLEDFISYESDDGGLRVYFPKDGCKLYARVDIAEGYRVTYSMVDKTAGFAGAPIGNARISECSPDFDQSPWSLSTTCNPVNVFGNVQFNNATDYCAEIDTDEVHHDQVHLSSEIFMAYYPPGAPIDGDQDFFAYFHHSWPPSEEAGRKIE